MGISEEDAPGSQAVNIGGKCLWMPPEAPDPVVQVVYCNE